mmetsp:Transcript_37647/g.64608  ORF Transcript_37647/g.64608 Transcript_37647/m.64608 type:complete len:113 (-) Transcript_37647:155-493(-)
MSDMTGRGGTVACRSVSSKQTPREPSSSTLASELLCLELLVLPIFLGDAFEDRRDPPVSFLRSGGAGGLLGVRLRSGWLVAPSLVAISETATAIWRWLPWGSGVAISRYNPP